MTTGSFPHDNFSSVYWIFNKPGHMIPLWRTLFILGSLPLYRLIIYIDGCILWCTHFLLAMWCTCTCISWTVNFFCCWFSCIYLLIIWWILLYMFTCIFVFQNSVSEFKKRNFSTDTDSWVLMNNNLQTKNMDIL